MNAQRKNKNKEGDMGQKIYHGTNIPVDSIDPCSGFGGLFCLWSDGPSSHGDHVLEVAADGEILTQFALDYEIDYDKVVEIIGQNTRFVGEELSTVADCVIDDTACELLADGPNFDYDADGGWEVQRLRGVLAKKLGYAGIECADEHGISVLIVSAQSIVQIL